MCVRYYGAIMTARVATQVGEVVLTISVKTWAIQNTHREWLTQTERARNIAAVCATNARLNS